MHADAARLVESLRTAINEAVRQNGGSTAAKRPGHREKFNWPPHPISWSFNVHATDWSGKTTLEARGESFEVEVARTPHGVFGRCEALWLEARGDTLEEMLSNLAAEAEPLFQRQRTVARALGREGRFDGQFRDLKPEELLRLLYCEDRDVANDAQTEIETHASGGLFTPALIEILEDRKHPHRRSAQWCVLDMFEDLPSFCPEGEHEPEAVRAIRGLIWDAEDDFARTTFKAGVVLGGHLPHKRGGPILLECLQAPSKIGRRSAIHGLFHVVEWIPDMRDEVACSLRQAAENEPEPLLREYASSMADDIEAELTEHVQEPLFPEEE